jgi:hypothetical protein
VKKITAAKSREMNTGFNLAESSKEMHKKGCFTDVMNIMKLIV